MILQKYIKTKTRPICKNYFNTMWEFWLRRVGGFWDWAADGPFCRDPNCGQRLRLIYQNRKKLWTCIRCGAQSRLSEPDLAALRERAIRFFEEEARSGT